MASSSKTAAADTLEAGPMLASHAGHRLDRVLTGQFEGLSRSRLQALIKSGAVTCERVIISDPGYRVKLGERFEVAMPPPAPAAPRGQTIPLEIVFEDGDLIVIDKPAGLVVHPAPGNAEGTLVNALIAHCRASLSGIGGVRRPGIVHRLDKETSGLLVVAKTDAAHRGLSEQFSTHGADGRLRRAYVALVWGRPEPSRGVIDAPIARSPVNRKKMAVARGAAGRRAVTRYEVMESFRDAQGKPIASLVKLELETGRTHQIRVHLAHAGHPCLGDPVYGGGFKSGRARLPDAAQRALDELGRQALHAGELGFEHPTLGKVRSFVSPMPPDMQSLHLALKAASAAAGTAKPVRR